MPRPFYIFLAAFAGTLLIAINPIGDLGIGIKAGLIWCFLAYVDHCERQHEKEGAKQEADFYQRFGDHRNRYD
jgi:hypothetical protein